MKIGQILPIEINREYVIGTFLTKTYFISELLEMGLFYVRYNGCKIFTELTTGKSYILRARWLHGPIFQDMEFSRSEFGDN